MPVWYCAFGSLKSLFSKITKKTKNKRIKYKYNGTKETQRPEKCSSWIFQQIRKFCENQLQSAMQRVDCKESQLVYSQQSSNKIYLKQS